MQDDKRVGFVSTVSLNQSSSRSGTPHVEARAPELPNRTRGGQKRKEGDHIWTRLCRGCRWSRGDRKAEIEREIRDRTRGGRLGERE